MHRIARVVIAAAAAGTLVLSPSLLSDAAAAPAEQIPAAAAGSDCPAPSEGTVRTFDDEPAGQPPAGTTTRGTAIVAAAPAGNQALHVTDKSTTADSAVIFPASAAAARRFGIDLAPHMAIPFDLAVHGVDSAGNDVVAYRLQIGPVYTWGHSTAAQVTTYQGTAAEQWAVIPDLTAQDSPNRMVLTASPDALVMQVGDFVFRTTAHVASAAAVTGLGGRILGGRCDRHGPVRRQPGDDRPGRAGRSRLGSCLDRPGHPADRHDPRAGVGGRDDHRPDGRSAASCGRRCTSAIAGFLGRSPARPGTSLFAPLSMSRTSGYTRSASP